MGNDNIIELNGKRYDALTGKLLGKSTSPIAATLPQVPRSMDGVVRAAPKNIEHARPVSHPAKKRASGAIVAAHRPQGAKTLMRRAVNKPKATLKPAIKTQIPSEIKAAPIATIARKHSASHVDAGRSSRAKQTPKHQGIARFTPATAVRTLPASSHQATKTMPAHTTSTPVHKDIFEKAIASAHSHEQPAPKVPKHRKKHRRVAGTLAGIGAFLILGGFLAYLNLPHIELKVASLSAGFSAHMPGYKPTGYQLTNVQQQRGTITLSFRSGSSGYQITQQTSNWNSQTLQDDIIAAANHETIEKNGRIIYVYDNVASWVNGGIRYDLVNNNANLSKDDIAQIAASM